MPSWRPQRRCDWLAGLAGLEECLSVLQVESMNMQGRVDRFGGVLLGFKFEYVHEISFIDLTYLNNYLCCKTN